MECVHENHTKTSVKMLNVSLLQRLRLILKRIRHRRELTALLAYSDHSLSDIGLNRDIIMRHAYAPLWRDLEDESGSGQRPGTAEP